MLEIKLQQNLDLDLTLDSGQCFRWNKIGDWWYGVIEGNVWKCSVNDGILFVEDFVGNNHGCSLRNDILHYFNLDRDYSSILDSIRKDSHMEKLLNNFEGMTVLNQYPYETLLSYILSANNNVPAIRKLIASVSQSFGQEIKTDVGNFFTFPTLSELENVSEEDLRKLKFGFRAKYFKGAVDRLVGAQDFVPLRELWQKSANDKSLLTNFYGVGEKIADCTRVYSLGCDEVVPVDVWIRRILTKLYNLPEKMKYQEVQDFAFDYFGEYAGWAQLFLFAGGRKKVLSF